jgi:hypothetical protein
LGVLCTAGGCFFAQPGSGSLYSWRLVHCTAGGWTLYQFSRGVVLCTIGSSFLEHLRAASLYNCGLVLILLKACSLYR